MGASINTGVRIPHPTGGHQVEPVHGWAFDPGDVGGKWTGEELSDA